MITKDINGNTLPAAYDAAIQADSRQFKAEIYKNGAKVNCEIMTAGITKGSCAGTLFSVGNVISGSLEATLSGLSETLKGSDISFRVGLLVGSAYIWVTIGQYTVTTEENKNGIAHIKGLGSIAAKLTDKCDEPATKTLARIATEIYAKSGVQVAFGAGIDTTLTIDEQIGGLTTYQALQVLASVVGGYATERNDGSIIVDKFRTNPSLAVNPDLMLQAPELESNNFEITGVEVIVEEGYDDTPAIGFSSGTPNLSMQNKYVNQALFDDLSDNITGYEYRPGKVDLSLGDLRLEASDVLSVTDTDGSVYRVPCHDIVHTFDGGFSSKITAIKATNEEEGIGSQTPLQRLINGIKSGVRKASDIAEAAKTIAGNTAQYFWFTETGTDTGAHITEIPQEDFLADPENGGGNLLARSNGVAVRDGLDELAQFGADGITLGQDTGNHNYLAIDYHSMQMIDRQGNVYFYISDLKDENGQATVTITQVLTKNKRGYHLEMFAVSIISVKINGVETTAYTAENVTGGTLILLNDWPTEAGTIEITYVTESGLLTAYTLGQRKTGEDIGPNSLVEGYDNVATGLSAHAEGREAIASGHYAHAEGQKVKAAGRAAHAEGIYTEASGDYSHAEGIYAEASGDYSHAGGDNAIASEKSAFAQGEGVEAHDNGMAAIGRCNATKTNAALAVGAGYISSKVNDKATAKVEKDALVLDWKGNLKIAGTLTQSSDRRLKDHIEYLNEEAEAFIRQLKPAHYIKDEKHHVGFYAQDVEEVDEWHCMTGELNGFKTLDYTEIIAPLVTYCQALERRIEELERGNE